MTNKTVEAIYYEELKKNGFHSDPAQLRAIQVLETFKIEWEKRNQKQHGFLKKWLNPIRPGDQPKGVYMFGGVGRGKSFLMDCFFNAVESHKKVRVHFHEFMREVHSDLQRLQGEENPLEVLGKELATKYHLLCFDEFHISDITDAMILYRLLETLFANGMGLVTTSNFSPDELYPDGLNRSRILPALALLNEKLNVINVDNGMDYRAEFLHESGCYFLPLDPHTEKAMLQTFERLKTGPLEDPVLCIESRKIEAIKKSGGVIWFDFVTLCEGPRSQNDYLELASQYQTILLSNVPQMSVRLASAARRFTWLIDVLYDRKVKLIMSAEVGVDALYVEGPMVNEFARTVSRINEMQSLEYLNQAVKLGVDSF